jgi:hypothetical protein
LDSPPSTELPLAPIEERKLLLDKERFAFEQAKQTKDDRRFFRNPASFLAFAISLGTILISGTQLYLHHDQARLGARADLKKAENEIRTQTERHAKDMQLLATKFVFENEARLFSGADDERKQFLALIQASMPEDIFNQVLVMSAERSFSKAKAKEAETLSRLAPRVGKPGRSVGAIPDAQTREMLAVIGDDGGYDFTMSGDPFEINSDDEGKRIKRDHIAMRYVVPADGSKSINPTFIEMAEQTDGFAPRFQGFLLLNGQFEVHLDVHATQADKEQIASITYSIKDANRSRVFIGKLPRDFAVQFDGFVPPRVTTVIAFRDANRASLIIPLDLSKLQERLAREKPSHDIARKNQNNRLNN